MYFRALAEKDLEKTTSCGRPLSVSIERHSEVVLLRLAQGFSAGF